MGGRGGSQEERGHPLPNWLKTRRASGKRARLFGHRRPSGWSDLRQERGLPDPHPWVHGRNPLERHRRPSPPPVSLGTKKGRPSGTRSKVWCPGFWSWPTWIRTPLPARSTSSSRTWWSTPGEPVSPWTFPPSSDRSSSHPFVAWGSSTWTPSFRRRRGPSSPCG